MAIGTTQRDLHIGIAKEFLAPANIASTLEVLEERLKVAMDAEDIPRTLAISQLITAVQKVQAKQGAVK